jgi:hypothetical protein
MHVTQYTKYDVPFFFIYLFLANLQSTLQIEQ